MMTKKKPKKKLTIYTLKEERRRYKAALQSEILRRSIVEQKLKMLGEILSPYIQNHTY